MIKSLRHQRAEYIVFRRWQKPLRRCHRFLAEDAAVHQAAALQAEDRAVEATVEAHLMVTVQGEAAEVNHLLVIIVVSHRSFHLQDCHRWHIC